MLQRQVSPALKPRGLTLVLAEVTDLLCAIAAEQPDSPAALLAAETKAHLHRLLTTRSKQSENAVPGGGRPPSGFVVDLDRYGACCVWGAAAAAELVTAFVRALDWQRGSKWEVKAGAMQTTLSRMGAWHKVVEADAGTVVFTVKRASPESEQLQRDLESQGEGAPPVPPAVPKRLTDGPRKKLSN